MITYLRSLDAGLLFVLAGLVGLLLLAAGYGALALLNRWLS